MKIVGTLDMDSTKDILVRLGVEQGGRVQKFIDSEVIRYCEPYVPYDSGTLTRSANTATKIGSGLVTYVTPYAHYMYYGEIYGDNIPMTIDGEATFRSKKGVTKHKTGRAMEYSKEVHPLAGSFWFDRAMADHRETLLQEVKEIAGAKHK